MFRMTFKSELQNATNVNVSPFRPCHDLSFCHARSDRIDGHPHRQQEDCTGMSNKYEGVCSSWSWYHSLLSAKLRSKWWNFFHPQHQLLLVTRAEIYLILACRKPKSIKHNQSHVVGFSTMQHGTLTPGKLNECAVMTKLLSTTGRYLDPLYMKSKVLLHSRDNMFAFCLVKWQRLQQTLHQIHMHILL